MTNLHLLPAEPLSIIPDHSWITWHSLTLFSFGLAPFMLLPKFMASTRFKKQCDGKFFFPGN